MPSVEKRPVPVHLLAPTPTPSCFKTFVTNGDMARCLKDAQTALEHANADKLGVLDAIEEAPDARR